MKVAHHGSEDPGLVDELRTLRPRIAVISCGRNNDYGHPRPETLAALAASPGLAVFRTDEDGRVGFLNPEAEPLQTVIDNVNVRTRTFFEAIKSALPGSVRIDYPTSLERFASDAARSSGL